MAESKRDIEKSDRDIEKLARGKSDGTDIGQTMAEWGKQTRR